MPPLLPHQQPGTPENREHLRSRFRKVILSRGYSERAADGILEEWFENYMQDVPGFVHMLDMYEQGRENEL